MNNNRLGRNWSFSLSLFLCSVFAGSSDAHADTGSAAWLKWRSQQPKGLCKGKSETIRLGTDIHSNYIVRGITVFHRPIEDLLAQKIGVLPELRWQYREHTEFTWDTAFAIQAPKLTRNEIRHSESVQNFRAHHCIHFADNWALLAAGNLALSFLDSGSLRYEAAVSLLRHLHYVSVEFGILEHQALLGESPVDWAFTHGHLEVFADSQLGNWRFFPYMRFSGEQNTFDWSGRSALAFQTGIRGYYNFESSPLRWTWSADFLQRYDLNEATMNISLGAQWGF